MGICNTGPAVTRTIKYWLKYTVVLNFCRDCFVTPGVAPYNDKVVLLRVWIGKIPHFAALHYS